MDRFTVRPFKSYPYVIVASGEVVLSEECKAPPPEVVLAIINSAGCPDKDRYGESSKKDVGKTDVLTIEMEVRPGVAVISAADMTVLIFADSWVAMMAGVSPL